MARKNRLFAKLASDVDTSGNLTAAGIQSEALDIGVTVYATRASLPASGNTAGDQAYVTGNSRYYIWNGSGWYNVALLNLAPSIQSVLDSDGGTTPFSLANDGTPTNITITATDSDGDPITYEYTADSDFSGLATLSQADNVFTVTPFSQDSATTTSGTITFTATDGVNTASSGVQTFTLQFVSALWDEVLFNLRTNSTNNIDNDTFADRSGNSRSVTIASGTPYQSAFHPYLDNWSAEFDGTDDYLTFADNTDWDFVNSGDFTVDFWMNSRTTSNISTFGQSGGGGSRPDKWGLYINDTTVGLTAGTIGWHLGSNGNIQGPSITINAGQWYHIQVSRSGDTWYFFQDGTLLGTASSTTRPSVVANTLRVGADGESYRDFNGYISNFRIVKGTNLNTSSFTSPTENLTAITNTVLLTCQDNRFKDNSSNAYTATVVGTPKISPFNPFGQGSEYATGANKGSIYFDGSSDYLDVDASTDIGTGDFTIQGWIYDQRAVTNERQIISNRGDGGSIYLGMTNTDELYPYIGGSYATTGADMPANAWNHFALCRTSGTLETYVNGVRYRSDAQGGDLFGTGGWKIGGGDVGQFKGWISDLRVATVADYTGASYTIPTSPVGNTSTDLYVPGDNPGIFDLTGVHTINVQGTGLKTSTTKTKYATTSMRVAAANDYIITDGLAMGGYTDMTIEGWFNFDLTASNVYIAGHNTTYAGNTSMYQLGLASGKVGWWIGGSLPSNQYDTTALNTDTWYHLAWVKVGTSYKIYKDGTEVVSFTNSNTINPYEWRVGNTYDGATQGMTGYIEDFQILNYAKYTATFTPPTQTQGRTYQATS